MSKLYFRGISNNGGTAVQTEKSVTLPVGTFKDGGLAKVDLSLTKGTAFDPGTGNPVSTLAQTAQQSVYLTKFFSPVLTVSSITAETWTLGFICSASSNVPVAKIRVSIYVLTSADTVRGYVYDGTADLGTVYGTAAIGQVVSITGAAVAGVVSTDKLVVEVWHVLTQGMATSYTVTFRNDGTNDVTAGGGGGGSYISTPQDLFAATGTPVGKALIQLWNTQAPVGNSDILLWNAQKAQEKVLINRWNVSTPAFATKQMVWNVSTPVGKSLITLWTVLGAVFKSLITIWNVLINATAVGANSQYIWNVRSNIGLSRQLVWNVQAAVGKSNQYVWNVRAVVGLSRILLWNVRAAVGQTEQFIWNVLANVGLSRILLWNVRAAIGTSDILLWSVRANVGSTDQLVWNVSTSVSKTNQYVWNTQANIGANNQYIWNVLFGASGTAVGASSQYIWNVQSVIGQSDQLVWNVQANVGKANQYVWNTSANVFKTVQYVWNVRANVGQTDQLVWNVRANVGQTDQFIWTTRANVGQSRILVWNVSTSTFKTNQYVWNTRSNVAQTRQLVWNINANVGQTDQFVWNVRSSVGASRQLVWNVQSAIGKAVQFVWTVLTIIGASSQYIWNILTNALAVGKSLINLWNVLKIVGFQLGPNLIPTWNGTFDTNVTGWSTVNANTSLVWDNGVAKFERINIAGFPAMWSTTYNQAYTGRLITVKFRMKINTQASSNAYVYLDDSGSGAWGSDIKYFAVTDQWQWFSIDFNWIKAGALNYVEFGANQSLAVGASFSIDDISIHEVSSTMLSVIWNVRKARFKDLITRWNVTTPISKTQQFLWNIRKTVTSRSLVNRGLVAHWDAKDITGFADGATFTGTWASKVGTATATQATGTKQPIYRATGAPNGRPCLDFDGVDDGLIVSNAGAHLRDIDGSTIFVVAKSLLSTAFVRHVIVYGKGTGTTNIRTAVGQTDASSRFDVAILDAQSSVGSSINGTFPANVWKAIAGRHQYLAGPYRYYSDGAQTNNSNATLSKTSNTDSLEVAIGANSAILGNFWSGSIAEILVYNVVLTDAEVNRVHSYLQDKHAITVTGYVQPSFDLLWNSISQATKSLISVWNTRSISAKNSIFRWNTTILAGKSNQYVWSARALADKILSLVWKTRRAVTIWTQQNNAANTWAQSAQSSDIWTPVITGPNVYTPETDPANVYTTVNPPATVWVDNDS